jgi:tetratricopeptide (TPR) repeat protein
MTAVSPGRLAVVLASVLAWGIRVSASAVRSEEPTVTSAEAGWISAASAVASTNPAGAIMLLEGKAHKTASAAVDFALGNFRMQNGDLPGACSAYENAVAKVPGFCSAWQNLGQAMLAQGKDEQAAAALVEAVRLDVTRTRALVLLGHARLAGDRAVSAEAAFRQALMTGPDDPDAMAGLLRALSLQDRNLEAAALGRELAGRMPGRSDIWSLRARAHIAMDEPDAALRVLETARSLGVADVSILLAAADIWLNAGVADVAVSRYNEARKAGTVSPDRLLRAARALFQSGNQAAAATLLGEIDPASPGPESRRQHMMLRLDLLSWQGRTDDVAAICVEGLSADPLDADLLTRLGDVHREKKEWEDALICFERVSRVKGHEADGLVKQAEVEVFRGRYSRAVELLEAAQSLDDRAHVRRYLEQVRRLPGQ